MIIQQLLHDSNALYLHILHLHRFAIHQPMYIAFTYQDPIIPFRSHDIGIGHPCRMQIRSPSIVPTGAKPTYRSETKNAFFVATCRCIYAKSRLPFSCFSRKGSMSSISLADSSGLFTMDSVTIKLSENRGLASFGVIRCIYFDRLARRV